MLTPGEFVVNAKATRNNLGLLKSINNGAGGYSRGGVIYAQEGAKIPYDFRFQQSSKPPETPMFNINRKRGLESAEIRADNRSLAEMEKSQAEYNFRYGYQDIPNEYWFGSPTRKETEYERQLRIANSLHPDMTPGPAAGFSPNLNAAMQMLGDIGSGYIAGGSARSSRSSNYASRRDPARPRFGMSRNRILIL
jgi:hypothetical protein